MAIVLSIAGVLGCFVAAAWLGRAPIMSGGRYPSLGEIAGMIAVPTIAAVVATWAAWQNRPFVLSTATALVGLFSFVTGFSIGGAFLPAFGLLVWAAFASFANGPEPHGS